MIIFIDDVDFFINPEPKVTSSDVLFNPTSKRQNIHNFLHPNVMYSNVQRQ